MNINLDIRTIHSPLATEFYISAVPKANMPPKAIAAEIFSHIRQTLQSKKATILQERVFATQSAMQTLWAIRSEAFVIMVTSDSMANYII